MLTVKAVRYWLKTSIKLWLCLLMVAGCQQQDETESALDWRAAMDFPVSFSGTLPCADCPGVDYQLNLFADQSFFLQTDYLDREQQRFYQLGRWQLHDQDTLVLLSDLQNYRFAINDAQHLTLLNQQGQIIDSEHNYQLQSNANFKAIYPTLKMRGLYQTDENGSFFSECLTGQRWSVAPEADYSALEKRYADMRQAPQQSLLVSAQAKVLPSDNNSSESRPAGILQITTFTGIWPGETCGRPGYKENLLDTYWKLTRLQNQPVIVSDNQREPSLTLSSGNDPQISGSDGCNRIIGSYQLKANKLKFSKIASTMMACPDDTNIAQRYHGVLEQVQFWKIHGQYLELSDKDGKLLARFQA
ncbi:MAG: META domain-containing protein, partial [Methylophaga sp.]